VPTALKKCRFRIPRTSCGAKFAACLRHGLMSRKGKKRAPAVAGRRERLYSQVFQDSFSLATGLD